MREKSFSYLSLVIVLTIFSKASAQCRPGDIRNFQTSQRCNVIYDALEIALVSDDNLYVIREAFFPSSDIVPVVLEVEYDIQRVSNGTLSVTLGWTESGVFAAINPQTLYNLQLGSLYWPLRNLLLNPRIITLSLDVESTTELSDVPNSEIEEVLDIMNARVSSSTSCTTVWLPQMGATFL